MKLGLQFDNIYFYFLVWMCDGKRTVLGSSFWNGNFDILKVLSSTESGNHNFSGLSVCVSMYACFQHKSKTKQEIKIWYYTFVLYINCTWNSLWRSDK